MFTKMIKTVCLLAVFALSFAVQATAATTATNYDGIAVELNDNKAFVFTIPSEMTQDLRGDFMANSLVINVKSEGAKVKVYADAALTQADVEAILAARGYSGITINVIEY